MPDIQHGTLAGYLRRCRCGPCRAANTDYMRARKAYYAQLPDRQIPHGTRNAYMNYSCRCDPCRQANSAYQRAYRRRPGEADGDDG